MASFYLYKKFCVVATCLMTGMIFSCNSDYVIKPRGYFKIQFPAHQYLSFDQPGFPYAFEYPKYARIIRDTSFFGDETENPWWINIDFPDFKGKIYISYKEIGKNDITRLVNDSYNMAYKHTSKASAIRDSVMFTPNGISGVYFSIGGNAATNNQFFVTDSVKHFLRGAMYFDSAPNADSLGIVNDFLKEDMFHLINSLKWK